MENKLPKNETEAMEVLKEIVYRVVNLRVGSECFHDWDDDCAPFNYRQYNILMNYFRDLSPELKEYTDILDDVGRAPDGRPFWMVKDEEYD